MKTKKTAVLVLGVVLGAGVWCSGGVASGEEPDNVPLDEQALAPSSSTLTLDLGAIHSVPVDLIDRVAVGDPALLDVTVVSSNELLLKATAVGRTTLLLWDHQGQRTVAVEVIDRKPEVIQAALERVLAGLNLPEVVVKREQSMVFVTGQVGRKEDLDQLEQMLSAFPGVTNLVTMPPPPPPPASTVGPGPLVRMEVQIIEINRSDLEKLGVNWSDSFSLTEPAAEDQTLADALFKWGTSLDRSSVAATISALVQQSKARVLSEPKLVTASGKEASSFIGLEVPIVMATSFGTTTSTVSTSIEFRQTGVLLKMTPYVLDDQRITTILTAEVSGVDTASGLDVPVGSQTVLVPGFKVRKTSTEVTTASGETIVIAGLLEVEDSDTVNQVPALGNLPVIGRLFRSPETESTQRELVIAVTPQLLADVGQASGKTIALEQAMAVAEVTVSSDDPKLRYALQVQDRIAKSLHYPTQEQTTGMGGRVTLRLHLLRDGTLGQVMIAQSSGIDSFDQEVLKVAQTQSPYPPFPSDVVQHDMWLDLPILFRL